MTAIHEDPDLVVAARNAGEALEAVELGTRRGDLPALCIVQRNNDAPDSLIICRTGHYVPLDIAGHDHGDVDADVAAGVSAQLIRIGPRQEEWIVEL